MLNSVIRGPLFNWLRWLTAACGLYVAPTLQISASAESTTHGDMSRSPLFAPEAETTRMQAELSFRSHTVVLEMPSVRQRACFESETLAALCDPEQTAGGGPLAESDGGPPLEAVEYWSYLACHCTTARALRARIVDDLDQSVEDGLKELEGTLETVEHLADLYSLAGLRCVVGTRYDWFEHHMPAVATRVRESAAGVALKTPPPAELPRPVAAALPSGLQLFGGGCQLKSPMVDSPLEPLLPTTLVDNFSSRLQ